MKTQINIAELLKDCPRGMKLDCKICNGVKFIELDRNPNFPIVVRANNGYEFTLTKYGQVHNIDDAKCVIFPKDKTTWEDFVPPCKFKDGDILFVKATYSWIIIYKESENERELYKYAGIPDYPNYTFMVYDCNPLCCKDDISEIRLATEEEKQKLFDAIKANGYKWNPENKTLEKLIKPKFKVGDRIKSIISSSYYTVVDIKNDLYFIKSDTEEYPYQVSFSNEINYKLISNKFDITTLVPFESKVLMRSSNAREWVATFYSHYNNNYFFGCGMMCQQCIPYEKNEHLLGTTDDCDEYYKTWE